MKNQAGRSSDRSGEAEQVGPERLVVEVGDERVYDGAADCRREHRRGHASIGPGVVTHQQPVETIHHLPERFVVREVPDDHRIAEERALRPAALDREVDDSSDQHLRAGRVCLGPGGFDRGLDPGQLGFGRGEHDLFLGIELVVDGPLGHAEAVGDHLERGPADTVLGEEVERDVDDPRLSGSVRRRRRPPGGDRGRGAHPSTVAASARRTSRSATSMGYRSRTARPQRRLHQRRTTCPNRRPIRSSKSSWRSASPEPTSRTVSSPTTSS